MIVTTRDDGDILVPIIPLLQAGGSAYGMILGPKAYHDCSQIYAVSPQVNQP